MPAEDLRGKVVIDTMNYYPQRDGAIAELDDESTTSSELLQAHLPEAKVVKAFNNIFFQHLAALPRPSGAEDRSALAIAGDDQEAKEVVSEQLDAIGYDTVDLGPLSEGWRTQPDTAAYGILYAVDPQAWDQVPARPGGRGRRARGGVASAPGRPGLTAEAGPPPRTLSGAGTASSVDRDGSAVGALPRARGAPRVRTYHHHPGRPGQDRRRHRARP